jgi:hypothetical protein
MSDPGALHGDGDITRSVVTDIREGRVAGIELLESRPQNITLHRIEDHELEMLMNISQPAALAVSTTSIGVFLGLLPSIQSIVSAASNHQALSSFNLILVALDAACLAVGVTTGVFAWRGQMQARRTLAAIRARPLSPMTGRNRVITTHAG